MNLVIFMKEQQLDALLENINYEISLLSNASAFIKQVFSDISWVGFYLCQDNQLILGPFQGKTACTLIPFNKGVCGACATNLNVFLMFISFLVILLVIAQQTVNLLSR